MRHIPAASDYALLWFPCDQGLGSYEESVTAEISDHGVEVWMADLLGSQFLPVAPSSMRAISGPLVAHAIQHVREQSRRPVIIATQGYGAIPVLRGLATLAETSDDTLPATLLIYPELYAKPPQPGKPPQYIAAIDKVGATLHILQPERTPGRWWLKALQKRLINAGSHVTTEFLPKVRGYFFSRRDPTPEEQQLADQLPEMLVRESRKLMESMP